jgi:hypothetical protein
MPWILPVLGADSHLISCVFPRTVFFLGFSR